MELSNRVEKDLYLVLESNNSKILDTIRVLQDQHFGPTIGPTLPLTSFDQRALRIQLCFVSKKNNSKCSCLAEFRGFFKNRPTRPLFRLFSMLQFYKKINVKNTLRVSGAGIQSHDRLIMSFLCLPLDHGSHRSEALFPF